jgi:hypothetical protein
VLAGDPTLVLQDQDSDRAAATITTTAMTFAKEEEEKIVKWQQLDSFQKY